MHHDSATNLACTMMIIPSGTASCDVSVTVDIKVKILFRHLVVGAVLTQLTKRLIEGSRQFSIIFT